MITQSALMDIPEPLIKAMRKRRESLGLSRKALAKFATVSNATIVCGETMTKPYTLQSMLKLGVALDFRLDLICNQTGKSITELYDVNE